MSTNKLYKAYDHLEFDMTERTENLYASFDKLLQISKGVQSELLRKLKPSIVISLKWRFDYLIKTVGIWCL